MNTIVRLVGRFFPNPYAVTFSQQQKMVFELFFWCILIVGKALLAKNNIAGRYIEIGTQALFAAYAYFVMHLFISCLAQIGFTVLSVYSLIKRSSNIDWTTFYDYMLIGSTVFLCMFITRRYIHHQRPHRRSQLAATCFGFTAYLCLAHHLPVGRLVLAVGHLLLAYLYFQKKSFVFVAIQLISIIVALHGYFN